MIRISVEEGGVFAVGMDGESMEVQEKSGWRSLSVIRMDVQSVGSVGNDVIKIRMEEASVFAVRMDGESTDVQGEDEVRAGMEKEFLLPLGWMASLERCT